MATGLVKARPETTAETQEIEGFVFICNPAAGPKSGVNDSGAFSVSSTQRRDTNPERRGRCMQFRFGFVIAINEEA